MLKFFLRGIPTAIFIVGTVHYFNFCQDCRRHVEWMNKRCAEEADFKQSEMYVWSLAINAGWETYQAYSLTLAMYRTHTIDLLNRAE